jgi:hypothetical protein
LNRPSAILTSSTNVALEGSYLGLGGVLAKGAKELAERLAGNLSSTLLVEEGEGLLVL